MQYVDPERSVYIPNEQGVQRTCPMQEVYEFNGQRTGFRLGFLHIKPLGHGLQYAEAMVTV